MEPRSNPHRLFGVEIEDFGEGCNHVRAAMIPASTTHQSHVPRTTDVVLADGVYRLIVTDPRLYRTKPSAIRDTVDQHRYLKLRAVECCDMESFDCAIGSMSNSRIGAIGCR
jgi:hypothetical protein